MLRVTVEFLRGGSGDPVVVGTAEIVNALTSPDRPRLGDYRCRFAGRGVEAESRVKGFPREELSAWHLIGRALAEAGLSAPPAGDGGRGEGEG